MSNAVFIHHFSLRRSLSFPCISSVDATLCKPITVQYARYSVIGVLMKSNYSRQDDPREEIISRFRANNAASASAFAGVYDDVC